MPSCHNEREHWNQRYRESSESWLEPDEFLLQAFPEYIRPHFPAAGHALDLAGGAGRNAIWMARQAWEITLIDIADAGIELAQRNAGPLASRIHFVVDDLAGFKAPQNPFDLVMAFFYLDRKIFPEIVKAIAPAGLLIYKTLTRVQLALPNGPKDPAHLVEEGELPRLAEGLEVLHYREQIAKKATAELVARKKASNPPN